MTGRRVTRRVLAIAGLLWLATGTPALAQSAHFGAPTLYDNGADTTGIAVANVDLDLDGTLDLVVAACDSGIVRVFQGNGDGTFGTSFDFSGGGSALPSLWGLAVADFNNDGYPDIATGNIDDGTVSILLNDGTGTFSATMFSGPAPIDVHGETQAIVAADLDGDNDMDLAVVQFGCFCDGSITILLGNGDGTFTEASGSPFDAGSFPYAIQAADLDGDNLSELVVPDPEGNVVLLFHNEGGGAFLPLTPLAAPVVPFPASPLDVAIVDVNGDTNLDIAAIGGDSGTLILYTGDGALGFSAPQEILTDLFAPNAIAAADFNDDGLTDLAVVDIAFDVAVIFDGNGTDFTEGGGFLTETGAGPVLLAPGDFNGDGKIDLAVGHAFSDNTAILLNDTTFVNVTLAGTGGGTVTSDLPGIDCGVDCEGAFAPSPPDVVLTATPAPGSLFAGWSGGGCSGTGTCTLTLSGDVSVTATFDVLALTPSVQPGGTVGSGYASSVSATNGTGPYTFTVLSGALPPGIDLTEDGQIIGTALAGGTFAFTVGGADANGVAGSIAYSIVIAAGPTTTAVSGVAAAYSATSQTVGLVATVSNPAGVNSGTVTFTVRDAGLVQIGSTVSGVVTDGIAFGDYTLPAGTPVQTLTITAEYGGDASFLASSGTASLVIEPAPTAIAAANATATFNVASQIVPLTATVTSSSPVNEGTVTFTVFDGFAVMIGVPVTSATVSGGVATADYSLPGGTGAQTLSITAVYNPATTFVTSTDTTHTLTIGSASTTTAAANATATFSSVLQVVPLSATVASPNGTVNGGTVTFTLRDAANVQVGLPVTSAPVAGGAATASYSLPGGTSAQTLTITAVYNGSSNFSTSTDATHTLTIGTAPTTTASATGTATFSLASQNVPLSATVTAGGAGIVNGGTVTFTLFSGATQIGTPVTSPTVTFGLAFAFYTVPGGTPAGPLTIVAAYSGATNFTASSDSSHTLTLLPAPTTPIMSNSSVMFSETPVNVPLSATVLGGGGTVPTGSVTFTVRTGALAVVGAPVTAPVSGGVATAAYTLPASTPPQTLTVTAAYTDASPANFAPGTSTALLFVACPAMDVQPSTAPTLRLGYPFSVTFTAVGPSDSTVALTGTPPPGLTVNGATVSGTPTTFGQFPMTATATSAASGGCTGSRTYPLTVLRPLTFVTGAGGVSPLIRSFDLQGAPLSAFLADDATYAGGVRVAMGDVTGDGVADIITAPGRDAAAAMVRVVDGSTLALVRQFQAYPYSSPGGTYVAAGDVNGDGIADIVTGRDGATPEVKVFDGLTGALISDFFAYAPPAVGGVRVAVGDVDGDGFAEIITGQEPGGTPEVRVFSGDGTLRAAFMAYDPRFQGGVFVAAGDIDGDGRADIVTGADAGGGPHVMAFSGADLHVLRSFFAYSPFFVGGVRVAVGDVDQDGRADIVTGAGPGGGPHVRVLSGATGSEIAGLFAYDVTFAEGVYVAAPPAQTRMAVNPPEAGATVPPIFWIGGWVGIGGAIVNNGVDAIHAWAVPVGGGSPIFVGATTTTNVPRPDVAAIFGGTFALSGFNVMAGPLPSGTYDLFVYAHSSISGTWAARRIVRITVTP
jgi:FG-GAP-like repeat/FG-GAP repeat